MKWSLAVVALALMILGGAQAYDYLAYCRYACGSDFYAAPPPDERSAAAYDAETGRGPDWGKQFLTSPETPGTGALVRGHQKLLVDLTLESGGQRRIVNGFEFIYPWLDERSSMRRFIEYGQSPINTVPRQLFEYLSGMRVGGQRAFTLDVGECRRRKDTGVMGEPGRRACELGSPKFDNRIVDFGNFPDDRVAVTVTVRQLCWPYLYVVNESLLPSVHGDQFLVRERDCQ